MTVNLLPIRRRTIHLNGWRLVLRRVRTPEVGLTALKMRLKLESRRRQLITLVIPIYFRRLLLRVVWRFTRLRKSRLKRLLPAR